MSFDDLFYPSGSAPVCADYPFSGGFLDVYGVLFDVTGGYVVNLWSNGVTPGGLTYGVDDATTTTTPATTLDAGAAPAYSGVDVSFSTAQVPEPGSLWLFGAGLLGLALSLAWRRRASRSL